MATKRKAKRFTEGGETEFSAEQEKWLGGADRTDPYILARMRRAVPDQAPVRDAAPAKTSAQMDMESSVQDALKNKQRDELIANQSTQTAPAKSTTVRAVSVKRAAPVDELTSVAKNRANAYKEAEAKANTPEAKADTSKYTRAQEALMSAKPSREDTQKGLEIISGGGAGAALKATAALARKMAAAKAAQGVEKFAEYSTPILEGGRKMLPGAQKLLGMKKGGAVKSAPKSSSASRRADGMASKGKTRGRMV